MHGYWHRCQLAACRRSPSCTRNAEHQARPRLCPRPKRDRVANWRTRHGINCNSCQSASPSLLSISSCSSCSTWHQQHEHGVANAVEPGGCAANLHDQNPGHKGINSLHSQPGAYNMLNPDQYTCHSLSDKQQRNQHNYNEKNGKLYIRCDLSRSSIAARSDLFSLLHSLCAEDSVEIQYSVAEDTTNMLHQQLSSHAHSQPHFKVRLHGSAARVPCVVARSHSTATAATDKAQPDWTGKT